MNRLSERRIESNFSNNGYLTNSLYNYSLPIYVINSRNYL